MKKLKDLIPNNKKNLNEESALDKMDVSIPAKVERFLDRAISVIKGYNLSRRKEELVVGKIVDAMGLSTSDLNRAVQKLKRYGVVTRKKTGNADHDWMGEEINEAKDVHPFIMNAMQDLKNDLDHYLSPKGKIDYKLLKGAIKHLLDAIKRYEK